MNYKHIKNLQESIDGMKKIFSISWSPNLMRLAVAHVDEKRSVRITLYDENGDKKDSFPTRPANKNNKSYVVREITFSPDSCKLAVSQSDNIVFVYRLGLNWDDEKKICNKFEQNTQVTTLIWPLNRPNELFFGIAEGKVKVGFIKTNSAQVLYSTDSYVVSLSYSPDNKFIISGHLDQSIYKYSIENNSAIKIILFSSIPYCLSWGIDILIAGCDYRVYFFNENGNKLQHFEYSSDDVRDFTLSRINSTYDTVAVGNYNRFFVFSYNSKSLQWEESCNKYVENYYTITALCWKPEVASLVIGSLCGSLDIFETCLKKSVLDDKYEITHVSLTQIIIKNLENSKRLLIKSQHNSDVVKINIFDVDKIVLFSKESIIIGDLDSQKYSEIIWTLTGKETFDFNNSHLCIINNSPEIAIVEIGNNEILGYCKTEYINSNFISARIDYENNYKIIAYLIDPNTILIQDLVLDITNTYNHDCNIEYIDFNKNGTKLIFRDTNKQLYLYQINKNRKFSLIYLCSFVQWIPNTQVLIAQDGKNLCIWYNIEDISNIKIIAIKGDIEEVRNKDNKTEVVIDEGNETRIITLDHNLINISVAIEENDLSKAVSILEYIGNTIEFEMHWSSLAFKALSQKNLIIAQRCFAALGKYSKVDYIKKLIKEANEFGMDNPKVKAKILLLNNQIEEAESLLYQNKLKKEEIYFVK